ncbi:MAG TPA: hypothetical protein VH281_05705 [Gaiellaceae bacterium]|jgi:hypothetical protein
MPWKGLAAGTEIGVVNGLAGAVVAAVGKYGGGGSVLAGGDEDLFGGQGWAEPGSR